MTGATSVPLRPTVHRKDSRLNTRDIRDAILDAIIESPEVLTELNDVLDDIAETWRELSPVGTGKYRRSITTERKHTRLTRAGLLRGFTFGRVHSTDDDEKVLVIEYGSEDTPEFKPMRKTLARFLS